MRAFRIELSANSLSDTVVTPELFARSLCDDFAVPSHLFVPRIVIAIAEKVREYQDQVAPMMSKRDGREECRGKLEDVDDIVFGAARDGLADYLGKIKGEVESEVMVKVENIENEVHENGGDIEMIEENGEDGNEELKVNVKEEDDEGKGIIQVEERIMTVEEATAIMGQNLSEELRILIKVGYTLSSTGETG